VRLVTVFDGKGSKPWHLVTNLELESAKEVVAFYKRSMWTKAMFRDLKNRDWGLGLDQVRLSEPQRHDRHFIIFALAYIFLCAFGAAAETLDITRRLKANTRATKTAG